MRAFHRIGLIVAVVCAVLGALLAVTGLAIGPHVGDALAIQGLIGMLFAAAIYVGVRAMKGR